MQGSYLNFNINVTNNTNPATFQNEQKQILLYQANRYNQLKDSIKKIIENHLYTSSGSDAALDALVKLQYDYPEHSQKIVKATAKLMRNCGSQKELQPIPQQPIPQQQSGAASTHYQGFTEHPFTPETLKRKPEATIYIPEEGSTTKRLKKLDSNKNDEPIQQLSNSPTDIEFGITDDLWKTLKHLLPKTAEKYSTESELRLYLEAACYIVRTNLPWSQLPAQYGDVKVARNRYYNWNQKELKELSDHLQYRTVITNQRPLFRHYANGQPEIKSNDQIQQGMQNLKVIQPNALDSNSINENSVTDSDSEEAREKTLILPMSNSNNTNNDYVISEDVWKMIQPKLPQLNRKSQNKSDEDNKRSLEGICWLIRNNVVWSKIPQKYGNWKTMNALYHFMKKSGTLNEISAILQPIPEATNNKSLLRTKVKEY